MLKVYIQNKYGQEIIMKKTSISKGLLICTIIFYLISGIMLYKGYDKMTNYYHSEYSTSNNVNAYVGGDAYNYIINGNYATGFFVLAAGFIIAGTICLSSGLIVGLINEAAIQQAEAIDTQSDQL